VFRCIQFKYTDRKNKGFLMSRFFSTYEQGVIPLLGELIRNWGKSRAQAAFNKYNNYKSAKSDVQLLQLQQKLYQHLISARSGWDSYDYGEGYYYQGLRALGITGFRDTDARISEMDLTALVAGKSVLEIGSNTGFLSLGIASSALKMIGIDINPYLIKISQDAAAYLNIKNVEFLVTSFEDFSPESPFECVISFANHSTYDGNTKQSLDDYFSKCANLLTENGLFLFESHPPVIEKENFHKTINMIGQYFSISSVTELKYGNHLDANRTFIVASKNN
jgi:cyclopropane fatty-acyl-phospholipid synthase-like methyltransferase